MKQVKFILSVILGLSILFVSPQIVYASALKINEILVHPGTGNKEWVEFYNPDKIDLSGYWLDDDTDFVSDSGNSAKKSLKDLLAADSSYPYLETSSMFNNGGDYVVLFDGDGNIIDQYKYEKDPGVDIAIGRSPDGSGDFTVLQSATKGSPNSNSQPTATLTPTDTPKSTLTPKPSAIPTNSPSSKATHTPTPQPAAKISTTSLSTANTKSPTAAKSLLTVTTVTEEASLPAVLGSSTSATPTIFPAVKKKIKTKIAGMQTKKSFVAPIALSVAGLSFIGCGILVFQKLRKQG